MVAMRSVRGSPKHTPSPWRGRGGAAEAVELPSQVGRFVAVGITTVALDYALLYLGTSGLGISYLISAGVAFLVASACNYVLSVRYVFISGKFPKAFEFSFFLFTSAIGLGINQLVMWFLVDFAGLNYMVAKFFSIIVVTVWNFLSKKKLVFIN